MATLLDAVADSETFMITRGGKPVARLVPAESTEEVAVVIAGMKAGRQARASMSRAAILAAREEGRR